MRDRWQPQEAEQRFSEPIRSVEAEGPQVVTRHGEDVAVVISVGAGPQPGRQDHARLVQRGRAGRSVLYYRTPVGQTLLNARQNG
jgi:prevent-host-death family protein